MKSINSIKTNSCQRNNERENTKVLSLEITKRLLEKYKPKDLYNIDSIRIEKHKKEAAWLWLRR